MYGDVFKNPSSEIHFYAQELKKRNLKPFLDCFDLSHLTRVEKLIKENLLSPPCAFNLVFDIPDALPYEDRYLDFFLQELPDHSVWFLTRHHARGIKDFLGTMERGGHIRVGYEDGPFLSSGKRARTNAELVEEVAEMARSLGRTVVSADRAREMMGMVTRR
jgi:3-keto-5-aminohexanoate cleavage enzyme